MSTATKTEAARKQGLLAPHETPAAIEAQQLCRVLERTARLCRTATSTPRTPVASTR